jgi:phosphohistidine swiveling domain-containing protein
LFLYPSTQANFVGSSRVTASCVDLEKVSSRELPSLAGKIAMIPRADPGFDWLFGQDIAGLITMYGGANSHMAIRAAEFGLPAAIGIGETRYASLSRASVLELDAANRRIQVLQ